MLSLATCVPQSHIHGCSSDNFIVIYGYDLDEFYDNGWKSETKFYLKHVKNINHSTIRNYKKVIKKISEKMQLVEIFRVNNVDLCILHTYKINIIKRLWKKYYYLNM
jgi:hypothetical protein